jgi:cyclomaltodextrinase / maltogenic alpha-amylase / neopullulanase
MTSTSKSVLKISHLLFSALLFSIFIIQPFGYLYAQTGENIPEWTSGIVWYQIFPERFNNADPSNDPTAQRIGAPDEWEITPWTSDWYQRAEWEQRTGPGFRDFVFTRRYGGDLQGVINKLDYLRDLGITGIYFNPIFDAVSLHKYDASHYHHIDRHFGPDPDGDLEIMANEDPSDPSTWQWTSADKLFLSLLEEAKERGIRIIIDGVWNHTGRDFWAFRDIQQNGQDSRFKEWYKIIEFSDEWEDGFDYEGWWGYKGLPEFTEVGDNLHPDVKEHIFHVTRRWMAPDGDVSRGVDGWRLDVAEEVGTGFWREWHSFVREINPEAVTVAEIWTDAARDYVKDDMFSIVMNYRWTYAVHDYFINRNIDSKQFDRRLQELRGDFPEAVNHSMQNLMDSHDTERLASMVVNAKRDFKEGSKIESIENEYDVRSPDAGEWETVKLIALFQFTYPGSPMVYYGTEAGMWGADDPDDRKPMVWSGMDFDDEINHPWSRQRPRDKVFFNDDIHSFYSLLGEIRKDYPVFSRGTYETLHAPSRDNVYAFARYDDLGNAAIVILNNESGEMTVSVDARKFVEPGSMVQDVLTQGTVAVNGQGRIEITLGSMSGAVLVPVL